MLRLMQGSVQDALVVKSVGVDHAHALTPLGPDITNSLPSCPEIQIEHTPTTSHRSVTMT